MNSGHVMVRLRPAQRRRAEEILRSRLSSHIRLPERTVRTLSTESLSLVDAVRLGPRGWSVAMRPDTARKIAAVVATEDAELAEQFRNPHPAELRRSGWRPVRR